MDNGLTQKPFEVLNELAITQGVPGLEQTRYLVVEGTTDRQVFKKFVQKPWVVRAIGDEELRDDLDFNFDRDYPKKNETKGRYRVIKFAEYAKYKNQQDITQAIIDRDFDQTNLPSLENLSCTDKRDLEATIASTAAFDLFFKTLKNKVNIDNRWLENPNDLRAKLFNLSAQIGKIRLLRNIWGWQLTFRNIKYDEILYLRSGEFQVNICKVWRCVVAQSTRYPSLKKLKRLMYDIKDPDEEISQGHDFCGFAAALLKIFVERDTHGHRQLEQEKIEAFLREAFRKEDLLKTDLGKHLCERKVI